MTNLDTHGTMVLLLQTEGDTDMTTSETILSIRRRTGLTQEAFGRRYGIPKRTVQNWEAGVNECPAYVAEMLEYLSKTDYHTPRLDTEESEE